LRVVRVLDAAQRSLKNNGVPVTLDDEHHRTTIVYPTAFREA
jgi:hypothetical protein